MTRRNTSYELIPVLVAMIVIPQLLFYWLVPAAATARAVVYGIGTVLTVAAPVTVFVVYHFCGLRRSMGVAITAAALEAMALVVCAVLMMVDAAVRSAVFALSIVALLYLAGLVPLVQSAVRTTAHETVYEGNRSGSISGAYRRPGDPPVPEHRQTGRTGSNPLPPRKR